MNALVPLPVETTPVALVNRAALAQRIAPLLREREANRRALRIALDRFDPPPPPAELTVIYRGPFETIEVDLDGEALRDQLEDFSPNSRRGRRIRELLRLHDEHEAQVDADRDASGVSAAIAERDRIAGELETAADAAGALEVVGIADVALRAAALIATDADYARKPAAGVLKALLEVAGAMSEREPLCPRP